jgi:hypothetical protein
MGLEATDGFATASVPFAVGKQSVAGTAADLYSMGAAVGVLMVGTWTDGTHAFDLEHSDDDDTYESAASVCIGSIPTIDDDTRDGDVVVVDYKGGKRYLRWNVTVSGSPATGLSFGAAVLGLDSTRKPYDGAKPMP